MSEVRGKSRKIDIGVITFSEIPKHLPMNSDQLYCRVRTCGQPTRNWVKLKGTNISPISCAECFNKKRIDTVVEDLYKRCS